MTLAWRFFQKHMEFDHCPHNYTPRTRAISWSIAQPCVSTSNHYAAYPSTLHAGTAIQETSEMSLIRNFPFLQPFPTFINVDPTFDAFSISSYVET
jgi:hypothetical protein